MALSSKRKDFDPSLIKGIEFLRTNWKKAARFRCPVTCIISLVVNRRAPASGADLFCFLFIYCFV